ncbi:MAG: ABC transporter permease, partial [Gammaproteobacteria bacterium]|nr:ABC transporter permease [Gammaproteobacteria bacterium]
MRYYGMIFVLIGLCLLFSLLTLKKQMPESSRVIAQMLKQIQSDFSQNDLILTVGAFNKDSAPFAIQLQEELQKVGFSNSRAIVGIPRDLRLALDEIKAAGNRPMVIATSGDVTKWRVLERMTEIYPEFSNCKVMNPQSYLFPDFLKRSNLLAIVDRIVVIAILAIGMTLVIITGGIDLSVGSLIAVSAVIGTVIMKKMGGLEASAGIVLLGFIIGILSCGIIGGFGGFLVARFKVPPFITTLGIMLMGRGLAFMITGGFSIYQVPKALPWLGQGTSLGIPNTVILLFVLYVIAHIFMSQTRLGRYIYAVGGNEEAARLSGVSVGSVIIFVYVISGITAGLGGCIQASQLNTGTPNMGIMYELYVIAAVVVGGTSLSGGTGKILGTLIGVFVISVIQNGMNLLGIESYTQQVVLGMVILGAVVLD